MKQVIDMVICLSFVGLDWTSGRKPCGAAFVIAENNKPKVEGRKWGYANLALSDNPYLGLTAAELTAKRVLYLQAEDDILKTGKSNAFPGWSITRADLNDIRTALSLLQVAVSYVTGTSHQSAQARFRTDRQFSRGNLR
jgi:hypothetical protein